MPEEPQELELPTRTTKDVLPKKPQKRRQRTRVIEEVFEPRIWMWTLTIFIILQLVGFLTCKQPSRGYYYQQRLYHIARAQSSTLTNRAVQIVLEYWTLSHRSIQDNLLPWIAHQWRVFRDGYLKFENALESPPRLSGGYFEYFSSSTVLALCRWLAMLVFAAVLGVLAFSILSKRESQPTSASLARTMLIKKPGAQGIRVEPALKTPIDKARVRNTRIWLVVTIFLGTAVLGLLMLYILNFVDVQPFWR